MSVGIDRGEAMDALKRLRDAGGDKGILARVFLQRVGAEMVFTHDIEKAASFIQGLSASDAKRYVEQLKQTGRC
jgi:hypothetical protein